MQTCPEICEFKTFGGWCSFTACIRRSTTTKIIQNQVLVIPNDYVNVVRCRDCKHRDPEDKKCDCGGMEGLILPRPDEWYCANGERRENDAAD